MSLIRCARASRNFWEASESVFELVDQSRLTVRSPESAVFGPDIAKEQGRKGVTAATSKWVSVIATGRDRVCSRVCYNAVTCNIMKRKIIRLQSY